MSAELKLRRLPRYIFDCVACVFYLGLIFRFGNIILFHEISVDDYQSIIDFREKAQADESAAPAGTPIGDAARHELDTLREVSERGLVTWWDYQRLASADRKRNTATIDAAENTRLAAARQQALFSPVQASRSQEPCGQCLSSQNKP